jgi:hypothetical protein
MHGSWKVLWSQSPHRSLGTRTLDVCTRGLLPPLPPIPVRIVKSTQYLDCTRNRITESIEMQYENATAAFTVHGTFVPMNTMSIDIAEGTPVDVMQGSSWKMSYEVAYFTPLTNRKMWMDMYGSICTLDGDVSISDVCDLQRTISSSRMHRLVRDSTGLTLFGKRGSVFDVDCSLANSIIQYAATGEW